jgi:hypothetical protein
MQSIVQLLYRDTIACVDRTRSTNATLEYHETSMRCYVIKIRINQLKIPKGKRERERETDRQTNSILDGIRKKNSN